MSTQTSLYHQMILDHNRKPKNFRQIASPSHQAEGFNPLCGDHLWVYLSVDEQGQIQDISFQGDGCAISKASASMMTHALKGKSLNEASLLFQQFQQLLTGGLSPDDIPENLGKLKIFSGIWQFPARVKCAALAWHTLNGALHNQEAPVCTEVDGSAEKKGV